MPRSMREQSQTGVYHVMLRGINQQIIFNDLEDYQKFIEVLSDCKAISGYEVFAYCLMNNHVHILLKVHKEELSQIFKRIGVRYVYWYNWKYYRRGHLFQDRFKSEPVEDEGYFLTVLRYIHQNPIKAGITKTVSEYDFSSYNEYIGVNKVVDTKFALDMMGEKEFIQFNNEKNEDKCMEYDYSDYRITDNAATKIIEKVSGCENVEQFLFLDIGKRDNYIKLFKEKGMSIRQISRLTGVSFGIIRRI